MMVELSVMVLMMILTSLMTYCFVDFKYHVSYMELRKEMFDMQMESMMEVVISMNNLQADIEKLKNELEKQG